MARRRKAKTRKVTHYQVIAEGENGERHPIGEPTTSLAEGNELYRSVRDPTRRIPTDSIGRPLALLVFQVEIEER